MKENKEEMVTLLVTKDDGEKFKITFPASYKVTFGVFSASNLKGGHYGGGHEGGSKTLRIYKSKEQQCAVFVGVKSFRDLNLNVERLEIKRKGHTDFEKSRDGDYSQQKEVIERRWTEDNGD